ncbi:hypothetical protein ACFOOM_12275 [Streptomyces echinoruber]|uniref:Uncharacterized protein n=1 Tax=Streptomyces echinoruber TaxID=68898 RepID=A0A918RJG7_9ACTN|nr:hypothetical protein [Streptomyces echinoruber]GHA01283.1 hypothetical protein GCM10010389_45780 [Streptomyces echinoruber]
MSALDLFAEPRPIVLGCVRPSPIARPPHWDVWTTDRQYLNLRYERGVGTVWTEDGRRRPRWSYIRRFDTGDPHSDDMTLTEFCERAGLQLADDAEVIGE